MKRRRKSTPLMLFWSRQDQRRFLDAMEQLVGKVAELAQICAEIRADQDRRRRKRTPPSVLTEQQVREAFPDVDLDGYGGKSGGLT